MIKLRLLLVALLGAGAACSDSVAPPPHGTQVSAQIESGDLRLLLRWAATAEYFEPRAAATAGFIVGEVTDGGLRIDDLELDLADTGDLRELHVKLGTQLTVGQPGSPKGWGTADLVLSWSYQTADGLVPLAERRVPHDDIFAGVLTGDRLEMNANVRSISDQAQEDIELVQLEFTAGGALD